VTPGPERGRPPPDPVAGRAGEAGWPRRTAGRRNRRDRPASARHSRPGMLRPWVRDWGRWLRPGWWPRRPARDAGRGARPGQGPRRHSAPGDWPSWRRRRERSRRRVAVSTIEWRRGPRPATLPRQPDNRRRGWAGGPIGWQWQWRE